MITKRIEQARGFGYKQPGGFYLTGRISYELKQEIVPCECCGLGYKPTPGWTWTPSKTGMLWVTESFYKSPAEFLKEAHAAGVVRRLAAIPRGFKIGDDVTLAHKKAIVKYKENGEAVFTPGTFAVFISEAIEYVVRGDESPARLADLRARGLTLVQIIKDTDAQMALEDQLTEFYIVAEITRGNVDEKKDYTTRRGDRIMALSKIDAGKKFRKEHPAWKVKNISPVNKD